MALVNENWLSGVIQKVLHLAHYKNEFSLQSLALERTLNFSSYFFRVPYFSSSASVCTVSIVARRRYRQVPRELNWSSSVGLWGDSISVCSALWRPSRRACSLNFRFLGNKDGEVLPLTSSVTGGGGDIGTNAGRRRSRYEKEWLILRVKAGELLVESLTSLQDARRSISGLGLGAGNMLRLFQVNFDFRWPTVGEHGAELGSFFITGNLSLFWPFSSQFSSFQAVWVLPLFTTFGIISVSFFRNFLASKSMLLSNWLCSLCIEAFIFWLVWRRSEFLRAQFLCLNVSEEYLDGSSIFSRLSDQQCNPKCFAISRLCEQIYRLDESS